MGHSMPESVILFHIDSNIVTNYKRIQGFFWGILRNGKRFSRDLGKLEGSMKDLEGILVAF